MAIEAVAAEPEPEQANKVAVEDLLPEFTMADEAPERSLAAGMCHTSLLGGRRWSSRVVLSGEALLAAGLACSGAPWRRCSLAVGERNREFTRKKGWVTGSDNTRRGEATGLYGPLSDSTVISYRLDQPNMYSNGTH